MTESTDDQPTAPLWLRTPRGFLVLAVVAGITAPILEICADRSAESESARIERIAGEVALLVDGDELARSLAARGEDPASGRARIDSGGPAVVALREAARREGLDPLRALCLKEGLRSRVAAAPGTSHAGALEVLLTTSDEDVGTEGDYVPSMAPAFLERSSASTWTRGLAAVDVRTLAPIRDSFGATVAVLEVHRSSRAGVLAHVLAWGSGLFSAGLLVLSALQVLGGERSPLRRLLEERRHAAALERRSKPRPRNIRTKLADASHTYKRLMDGEDTIDRTRIEGPLRAAVQSVHDVVDLAQIRVVTSIADELRGRILADPPLVFAILLPLLENAVQKTRRGGSVSIRAWTDPRSGDLRYDISDSGVGISFREQDDLLRPLTQADRPDAESTSGLDVARSAAAGLGGSIGFESQPGHGTRFWFVLPAARAFELRAAA